ncbi:MAG: ImmA/IrrE family metallo-endopeptidase [Gammaproteobacteria bacterium]|nr:ImmA/IrrE family metallo-endopeptidase [Gammaproteobacteria bacterium]
MRFSLEWQDDAPNASAEERATVADLQVFVDEVNVCEHLVGQASGVRQPSGEATVSAYPIAEALAFEWWRLFGRRDDEFRLFNHRCGYALPDLRISHDGERFTVVSKAREYANPPVFFYRGASQLLSKDQAESAIVGLISQAMERLRASGVPQSALALRWERVRASIGDANERAFCEAAGAMNLDPYALSDEAADFIERAGALLKGDALLEFLSGLPLAGARASRLNDLLNWMAGCETRPRYKSRLPLAEDLRQNSSVPKELAGAEPPWARGYRCARRVRDALNAGPGERFRSVSALARRLDAPNFSPAAPVSGVRAVLQFDQGDVRVHLGGGHQARHRPESALFAFGRAVGDAIGNPPVVRSVVNDLHDASRQALGRAFAAEFLAPVEEILSMREDGKDTAFVAEEFGVSEEVVERQLQNRHRIQTACAA